MHALVRSLLIRWGSEGSLQGDGVLGDVTVELGLAGTDVVEGFGPFEAVFAA
jgi:hypothetical protein